MSKPELGSKVLLDGRPGIIGATSGTDQTCLVKLDTGKVSPWIPWEKPVPVKEATTDLVKNAG